MYHMCPLPLRQEQARAVAQQQAEDRELVSALNALGLDDDPDRDDVALEDIVAALNRMDGALPARHPTVDV